MLLTADRTLYYVDTPTLCVSSLFSGTGKLTISKNTNTTNWSACAQKRIRNAINFLRNTLHFYWLGIVYDSSL